jgi:predicted Ser/Thr protein kinase
MTGRNETIISIAKQLKAYPTGDFPEFIIVSGNRYHQTTLYKHDYFAVTGMFTRETESDCSEATPNKIIIKMARKRSFMGIPQGWLGRLLTRREFNHLHRLEALSATPNRVGLSDQYTIYYEYIEGVSLDENPALPDDFFDNLKRAITDLHALDMAYVDMNKRGNILFGADKKPHIIDFQISWFSPKGSFNFFSRYMLRILQKEDLYHLKKQKRRFRRDLMSEQEIKESKKASLWIFVHRLISRPLNRMRRASLGYLYKRGELVTNDLTTIHPETDPSRWAKKK